MAGARITVDVTDESVRVMLRKLADATKHPTEAMEGIGGYAVGSVQQNFEAEGRPDKWKERKSAAAHPLLRDSNRLFDSITYEVAGDAVYIGTNVAYAAAHQFGVDKKVEIPGFTRTRRGKRENVSAHERHIIIPARPYLMLQSDDDAAIVALLENFLEDITQ